MLKLLAQLQLNLGGLLDILPHRYGKDAGQALIIQGQQIVAIGVASLDSVTYLLDFLGEDTNLIRYLLAADILRFLIELLDLGLQLVQIVQDYLTVRGRRSSCLRGGRLLRQWLHGRGLLCTWLLCSRQLDAWLLCARLLGTRLLRARLLGTRLLRTRLLRTWLLRTWLLWDGLLLVM